MPRRACPSQTELSAFNLGELPGETLEEIARHLEECPRCEEAAQALDGVADPVVRSLRGLSGVRIEPGRPERPPQLPSRVGPYEILGELGRGGMGVVYKARHTQLQRVVALKMLLGGEFTQQQYRTRFRAEAEAVARLQHPHIVQVFDIGEWCAIEGAPPAPFFTLEYVEGGNLRDRLAGKPKSPEQAADWLLTLARAVHYAHSQGIVHRDLKPSNVLVTAEGQLKLCDFGVAKILTGSDLKTLSGMLVGTPEYMAPELALGQGRQAGLATDIYALGAILYTMLTGRPPFQGASVLDTLDQVRAQEPVGPRRLQPRIPFDLETICLKCLEKEPSRRYLSAADLADDLSRFRGHRAIRARPTPTWERIWKWTKRRPLIAGLSALVVFITAVALGLVTWQWQRAEAEAEAEARAKQQAMENERAERDARRQVERLSAHLMLNQGVRLCDSGEVGRGLLYHVRALELACRASDSDLEQAARYGLACWRPFFMRPRALLPHADWVWAVALSPDGRTVLTGSKDGTARRWDVATGRASGEPLHHGYPVWAVAFSPDGKIILTAGGDDDRHVAEARLWDAATGKLLRLPLAQSGEVASVAFSPDGATFLTVCEQEARIWRTADGKPVGLPMKHPRPAQPNDRLQPKLSAVFSPDGKLLATGGEDGTARLWDSSGRPRGEPLRTGGPVLALAFSPDSRALLTGSADGTAQLWDTATGQPCGPALRHRGPVRAVALSSDGRIIATGGTVKEVDSESGAPRPPGGEVRLWQAATRRPLGASLPHPAPVWSLAFSPAGRTLLTGCEDGNARFFAVAAGALLGKPIAHDGTVTAVAFSRDGRTAVTSSAGGNHYAAARLWDTPPEQALAKVLLQAGNILTLAFSPDGRALLTGATDRTARLWDLATGREVMHPLSHGPAVRPPVGLQDPALILGTAFSPDGRKILTAGEDGDVRLWDRISLRPLSQFFAGPALTCAAFSPDGKSILIGKRSGATQFSETSPGIFQELAAYNDTIWSAVFTPDQRSVITGGECGARCWDCRTGRLLQAWPGPTGSTKVFLYPNSDKALVVAGGFPHVWDVASGQVLGPPRFHAEGGIRSAVFSPDGRHVLISDAGRVARLWDVATGTPLGPPLAQEASGPVAFSLNGRRAAAACSEGRVSLWQPPPPIEGTVERIHLWAQVFTGMGLDRDGAIHDLSTEALSERARTLDRLGGPPH